MVFMIASCKSPSLFSAAEQKLILSGDANVPFSVLKITDKKDSIALRTVCSDVGNFVNDTLFAHFIARLKTTLLEEQGVGIAAPQVGILKNVFLFMRLDLPDEPVVVAINPKITRHPDATICFERDGCLSVPDFSGNSVRYPWVEVSYHNEKGELVQEKLSGDSRQTGFSGIIYQHEYDHLQGILFIDKLCAETETVPAPEEKTSQ
jgi:peptide deformylase